MDMVDMAGQNSLENIQSIDAPPDPDDSSSSVGSGHLHVQTAEAEAATAPFLPLSQNSMMMWRESPSCGSLCQIQTIPKLVQGKIYRKSPNSHPKYPTGLSIAYHVTLYFDFGPVSV